MEVKTTSKKTNFRFIKILLIPLILLLGLSNLLAQCSITNFTVTDATCGDPPFFQNDSYFEATFDIVGGSGSTYILLNPANNVSYGTTGPGQPTDGTITVNGQASITGVTPGSTTQVVIIDQMNASCMAGPVTINVPVCPPPDLEAPTSACADPIRVSSTLCGTSTNPNTPSGGWGAIPANGMQTLLFGFPGGAFIDIDFNCLSDDVSPIGEIEIRLASSAFVSGADPCGVYLENVYDVRDAAGNEAPGLITILVEFTGCSADTEAPTVTCAEFSMTFDGCPNGLGPNTPNGEWRPLGPTLGINNAVGGSYGMFLDLSTCVTDDMSALADIEYTLLDSYAENVVPGCSIDLINEWQLRDECGNVSPNVVVFRGTITYSGTPPPMITCPPNITLQCDESTVPIIDGGSLPSATATDNCDQNPMIAYDDTFTPGSCPQNRIINRTWSAITACGVTSTCVQTITIQDTEGPMVTCAPFTTTFDDCPAGLGPNTPTGAWITIGADGGFTAASGGRLSIPVDLTSCVMDNCGDLANLEYSLHSSYAENVMSCAITLVNEFSIRDECGNVAADRVVTKITIQDVEAPDVTCTEFSETFNRCPDPLGPNTPSGNWIPVPTSGTFLTAVGGSSIGTIDLNGCVTDNCVDIASGGFEYMVSDSYEENRVPGCSVDIINEYMIRDICGNVSPVKFNFRGMIRFDGAPPVITCPADEVVNCGDPTDPTVTGMAMATSECGTPEVTYADVVAPGVCPEQMVITRTWTATDACGKTSECDQIIMVECPLMVDCSNIFDETLSCRADLPPVDFDLPIIIQSCGDVTLSALTIIPGNSGCPGDEITITRTYFIQDQAGNMEQCMQTFTVVSNVLPTITCPAGGIVECAADIVVNANNAVATVECGTPALAVTGPIINGDPDCPSTTYTYTYTVTDACGRTESCDQVFTIENDPPTITCPADMTVECFADISVDPMDATVVTSCTLGFNTVISGPVQMGQSDCPGTTYTYTYTTTDDCGRVASCDQIFTIQNVGPILTCPAPVTVECADDIVVDPSDVGVITSCGLTFTAEVFGPNIYDGDPDCPGARYVYRYLVEDECGRIAICEREFIIDNAAPTVTCIGNQIVECEDDIILDPEQVITVVTSCDLDADIDIDGPNLVGGVPTCNGAQYSVTYTVTDPCGRTDQCTVIWTLANSGPMIVTCAPNRIVECQFDIASEPELLNVELACGTYQIFPSNIFPINVGNTGNCPGDQYGISYEVIDVCGRSASCIQVWTIENEAPRVIPPDPITVACLDDVNPDIFDAEAETSCGLPIVKREIFGPFYDESSPLCAGSVVNYLYSFWDACGRMTCEAQIVTINPGATIDGLFDNIRVECGDVPPAETSFEACGIRYDLEVTERRVDHPSPRIDSYRLIRTYTAVDVCGNEFEIEQTISVICRSSQSTRFTDGYSDVDPNGKISRLDVFPNPAISNINYVVKAVKEEVTVRVYSVLGNLVYEQTWQDSARENISLDGLPSGVYQMVLFENDRVVETKKFLKQAD